MHLIDDVSAINFQISDDGTHEDSDEEERDIGAASMQTLQTLVPVKMLEKNGSIWTSLPITLTERTQERNVFLSTPGVAPYASATITLPDCAWKHFIHETILCSFVKFTNEEAKRQRDRDFLSECK